MTKTPVEPLPKTNMPKAFPNSMTGMDTYLVQLKLDDHPLGDWSYGELVTMLGMERATDESVVAWARQCLKARQTLKQGETGFRVLKVIHEEIVPE